jgi:pimeloyl-ACP methyl ester carboxylesterase
MARPSPPRADRRRSATIPRMLKLPFAIAHAARRRARCALASVGVMFLVAGCGDRAGTHAAALHECRIPKLASAAQCATVEVPEDRSKPGGRLLGLSVVVLPANTLSPDADPLFMVPGGPGQSAEALVPVAVALAGVRRSRDLVLIDPRGGGKSAPLTCPAMASRDALDDLLDDALDATAASRCLEELRASNTVDISQYTTPQIVADIDAIRAALGYERINLWGGSYGTRVAQEYARRYPSRVRSMVLDGVAPPAMRITLDGWPSREAALASVFAACAEDASCKQSYPNLNASLAGIKEALETSPRVTIADPHTGVPHEILMSFDMVVGAIQALLNAPELASLVPPLLARAEAGDFAPLVAAATLSAGDLSQNLNLALHYAITCAEDAPRITTEETMKVLTTLRAPALAVRNLASCDGWPRPVLPADFYAPLASEVPTLILSGALDPVTPPMRGQTVAATLSNSRHVVAAGYGHIVTPHACLPRLIEKFVADAGFAALPQSCLDYLATSRRPPVFSSLLESK